MAKMSNWMTLAANNGKWGKHVENKLKLAPATYKPYAKHQYQASPTNAAKTLQETAHKPAHKTPQ
jgi:hypothetical protein